MKTLQEIKCFNEQFADLFVELPILQKQLTDIISARAGEVDAPPRAPTPYNRRLPTAISLDQAAIGEFAKHVDMHGDEMGIVLSEIFKSDNPIIIGAFKRLISSAKICTDLADRLSAHRNREREKADFAAEEHRDWKKRCSVQKREITNKANKIKAKEDAYRKTWLAYVKGLEDRFNAVQGDLTKMKADDAAMVRRANKGTKVKKPFEFLRRQKGEKCYDIMRWVSVDVKNGLVERNVKQIMKNVKDAVSLDDTLRGLSMSVAEEVFRAAMESVVGNFYNRILDPKFDINRFEIYLDIGYSHRIKDADSWAEWYRKRKDDELRLITYESNPDLIHRYKLSKMKYSY